MDGNVNDAAPPRILKLTTTGCEVMAEDSEQNLITLCSDCHLSVHARGRSDPLPKTQRKITGVLP